MEIVVTSPALASSAVPHPLSPYDYAAYPEKAIEKYDTSNT